MATTTTIPEPLARHQASLFLTFSAAAPPYAELAASRIAARIGASPVSHIRIGLAAAPAAAPLLCIPRGPHAADKCTITGKASIVRFFARALGRQGAGAASASSLYPENDVVAKANIDNLIDRIRAAAADPKRSLADDLAAVVAEKTAPAPLVGSAVSIADLIAWDALVASKSLQRAQEQSAPLASWIKHLHAHTPELDAVVSEINDMIETAPILDVFRDAIIDQIQPLTGAPSELLKSLLEEPRDRFHGDISLPLPRARLPGNPADIAKSLAERFVPNSFIIKAHATGPFLNFFINKDALRDRAIRNVIRLGTDYGKNASGFGKFAVVEYSSPNIAKPFHVGHLRSTIIGSFIKKVLDASGWGSVSINYLGDWGKQFGLLAVGFEKYGSETALEADPIRHLYEIYVRINVEANENEAVNEQARAYFKRMEDGDEAAFGLWKKFRDLSIVRYRDTYARLGIQFDVYSGESEYSLDKCQSVMEELTSSGLLVPDQGALIVDLKPYKLGTAVIGKTDGSLLYLSRDIAAASDRHRIYDFDAMFYVVATQQDHHFKQLFKILDLQGKTWADRCHHINFGIIKSKDGNMSTRKGTVVFLQDILENVKEEMHSVMRRNEAKYAMIPDPEYVSDILGISAVMIQDMAARRARDYVFDWARVFSFEGDTGPYLQYAHSRLCSIERQAAESNVTNGITEITPQTLADSIDLSLLTEPQVHVLVEVIALFPDIVTEVGKSLEPCTIVAYALKLSHAVSSALDVLWVMGQTPELARARLALYVTARITLGNALKMLGLVPVSRM